MRVFTTTIQVRAVQWDGANIDDVTTLLGPLALVWTLTLGDPEDPPGAIRLTLGHTHLVAPEGHWIIRRGMGNLRVADSVAFAADYTPAGPGR